jgi:hypothetical protein
MFHSIENYFPHSDWHGGHLWLPSPLQSSHHIRNENVVFLQSQWSLIQNDNIFPTLKLSRHFTGFSDMKYHQSCLPVVHDSMMSSFLSFIYYYCLLPILSPFIIKSLHDSPQIDLYKSSMPTTFLIIWSQYSCTHSWMFLWEVRKMPGFEQNRSPS